MGQKLRLSIPTAFSVILGVLAPATLITQVVRAGGPTTATETALFSVLQFVFSLAFAWLLTRIAAKHEFVEGQRAFAIAAYRRINEIDQGIERLLRRARRQMPSASPEAQRELDVLIATAQGVRASVHSSIADWGDIIGEEITTIARIERIENEQEALLAGSPAVREEEASEQEAQNLRKQLQRSNKQITELLKSLPYPLRIAAEHGRELVDPVERLVNTLDAERAKTGTIELHGFWDPSLEADENRLQLGETVHISIDSIDTRLLVVCARDKDGKVIGIIMNNRGVKYYVFREALIRFMGRSSFDAEIVEVATTRSVVDRREFKARVLSSALPDERDESE